MRAGARLAPTWLQSSWLASQEPREVSLALISPPLTSQPGEAAPEKVLGRPPREAWRSEEHTSELQSQN